MIGRATSVVLSIITVFACSQRAQAEDIAPGAVAPDIGAWRYQVSLDAWVTALNGDVGLRGLPPADVNLSAWDAVQNLDGAFAGSFQATDGTWLLYTDFLWAKLSADAGFGPSSGEASLKQEQILFSALLGYSLPVDVPNLQVFGTAGFRYQHYSIDLNLDPTFFPAVRREGSQAWIDPVVGAMLHYDINDSWFIDANADIGGFGLASDFTAQGKLAVGYNWTDTISSTVGYRALYTDYKQDGFVYKSTQHGLFTNLIIHF